MQPNQLAQLLAALEAAKELRSSYFLFSKSTLGATDQVGKTAASNLRMQATQQHVALRTAAREADAAYVSVRTAALTDKSYVALRGFIDEAAHDGVPNNLWGAELVATKGYLPVGDLQHYYDAAVKRLSRRNRQRWAENAVTADAHPLSGAAKRLGRPVTLRRRLGEIDKFAAQQIEILDSIILLVSNALDQGDRLFCLSYSLGTSILLERR